MAPRKFDVGAAVPALTFRSLLKKGVRPRVIGAPFRWTCASRA